MNTTTTHINNPIFLTFETHQIRIVLDDQDTPWFNANNVCAALEHTNPAKALANHVRMEDRTQGIVIESPGITSKIDHINASGVYSLIACSPKKTAKRFTQWFIQNLGMVAFILETKTATKQTKNHFTVSQSNAAYHIKGALSALADLLIPIGVTPSPQCLSHVRQGDMASLILILSEQFAAVVQEVGLNN